jgi:hypothetical protein
MLSRFETPRSLSVLPLLTFTLPKFPVTAPLVRRSSVVLILLRDVVVVFMPLSYQEKSLNAASLCQFLNCHISRWICC